MTHYKLILLACFAALPLLGADGAAHAAESAFTRESDLIYGRKHGMALTLDVFTPNEQANGAAVIWVVSGGWFSAHDSIVPEAPFAPINELVQRGYTVFAVVHGSQPKFTVPEILADMHRATRFVRHLAQERQLDPERIGITGASAGGHLSLMQATAGDLGDPQAEDPINRESSRVQAAACFYPPTDFLNYGEKGKVAFAPDGDLTSFRVVVDVREFDPQTKLFERISNEQKISELYRNISPITHVTEDDPPTLIIHGDKDSLVPMQQAEAIVAQFNKVGVPAELVVKQGGGHGWPDLGHDWATIADWFDEHLQKE